MNAQIRTGIISNQKQVPLNYNPCVWLDGADPNGNGTIPANGTSMSTWVDKSKYKNNFTQGTVASQPTYTTNLQNSKGGFTFPSTQSLVSPNPCAGMTFTTNPRSTFIVFQFTGVLSGNNNGIWG